MDSEASATSNIDDLESEVHSAIFRSKLDLLQDMAQLLKVEKAKFQGKSRSTVAKLLSKQVSEQLDELETDQTKFEYLKTLIDEFHKLELPDLEQTGEDKIAQVELNILKEEMKKLEMKQKAEKEDLENKIKALKHVDKSVSKTVLENSEQKLSEPKHNLSLPDNCLLKKDFRLYGQIGIANQPDKLSFISLMNQIDSGLSKGHKEKEIIEAVIRAIVPSLPLRSYLESVKDLTLNQLKSILRSHYLEKQGAELYQMLTTLSQLPGEDPRSFLLRGMNIKQKLILQGSQEDPYNLTYNPEHVQMLFLKSLAGNRWFSTLDQGKAYHHGFMSEKSQSLTAFITPWGLYEFVRIPFGLSQAPGAFQRFMERVIGSDLRDVIAIPYLDDVICFSKTFDEHLEHLRIIFKRLKESGIKLKARKCKTFRKQVQFLGRVVSEQGYTLDPKSIEAVTSLRSQTPRTVGDVRKLLGFLSYFRQWILQFSTIAKPLYDLTSTSKEPKTQQKTNTWKRNNK